MTEKETLFLRTLDDLQSRLDKNDEYNLIRASALIRQLLIDDNPLVDLVNRKYKLKILFRVIKKVDKKIGENAIDEMGWKTVIRVSFIDPKKQDNDEYVEHMKRSEFLKYDVIYFAGHTFTVIDIIKLCAHIYGGVHAGEIKSEEEQKLDWANKMVKYHDDIHVGVSAMKDIIVITINALTPLAEEIRKSEVLK